MNDSMLIGVPQIDNQHRTLLEAMNNFTEACNQGKGRKQIEETMNFVVSYTKEHFRDEERIQEEADYPGITKHKWIHSQIIMKVDELVREFRQTGPTIVLVGKLNATLVDWVINHIKTEDRKIGEHIQQAAA